MQYTLLLSNCVISVLQTVDLSCWQVFNTSKTHLKLLTQTAIGPQRPQISTAELWKWLNLGTSIPRKRKRNLTKAHSSKSRNYRQPPTKHQQMNNPLHPQLSPIQHARVTHSSIQKGNLQRIKGSGSENEDSSSHLSSSEVDTDQISWERLVMQ